MKPWTELPEQARERVTLLLGALTEFDAGFTLTSGFTKFTSNPMDPPNRFLKNCLHQYLDAFYLDAAEGTGVLPVLRAIALDTLADEVQEILDTTMGKTTIGKFMREYRNKVIAHPTYSVRRLFSSVYEHIDDDDEALGLFQAGYHFLLMKTLEVREQIREAYPEAVALTNLSNEAPDNTPAATS